MSNISIVNNNVYKIHSKSNGSSNCCKKCRNVNYEVKFYEGICKKIGKIQFIKSVKCDYHKWKSNNIIVSYQSPVRRLVCFIAY